MKTQNGTDSVYKHLYNADMASLIKGDQTKREDGNQFCVHLIRCVLVCDVSMICHSLMQWRVSASKTATLSN